MVKIINGEIVPDNDPRVRKTSTNASNSSDNGRTSRLGTLSNIAGLGDSSEDAAELPRQLHRAASGPAVQELSPLDQLAQALKIQDLFITIPAIPQLKMTTTKIGLVYFIPIGILYLIFGYRALVFAVALFAMYKHSESNTRAPTGNP